MIAILVNPKWLESRKSTKSAKAFYSSNVGNFVTMGGARNQKLLFAPAGPFLAKALWLRDTQRSHLVA